MSNSIPIQNIYYLLCYAWGRLEPGELKAVDSVECETLQDLLAKVLIQGTKRIVKRGINRNYEAKSEETASLRGRIAFTPSVRGLSWTKGAMVCEFTELSYNTIPNRILKTTLRNLQYTEGVSHEHVEEIRGLLRQLSEVSPIRVSGKLFRRIQYHQNLRDYRLLMSICELVHESLIPTESAGQSRFRDFIRDPKKMPALFEAFVYNFYLHELPGRKVFKSTFTWQETSGDEEAIARLPTMNTDVELEHGNQLTILDCKYYKDAFTTNWEVERYKTPNLYQLYAYIMNKQIERPGMKVSGMLLYPEVHQSFCHRFKLQSHPVCIASVNLDQPWQGIKQDLIGLVD